MLTGNLKYFKLSVPRTCCQLFSVLTIFLFKHIEEKINWEVCVTIQANHRLLWDLKFNYLLFGILSYVLCSPLQTMMPSAAASCGWPLLSWCPHGLHSIWYWGPPAPTVHILYTRAILKCSGWSAPATSAGLKRSAEIVLLLSSLLTLSCAPAIFQPFRWKVVPSSSPHTTAMFPKSFHAYGEE